MLKKYICPRCKVPRVKHFRTQEESIGFKPPKKCNLCFHQSDADLRNRFGKVR